MKKILLLCAAVLTTMGLSTASAQFEKHPAVQNAPRKVAKEAVVTSRAAGTTEISYCDDYIAGIGIGQVSEIGGAIGVPAFRADALKGSKVTKVKIGLGLFTRSNSLKLFIAPSLDATPVYEETFAFDKLGNSETGEGKWLEFTLATPYEIQGEFYVGYKVTPSTKSEYPLGMDYGSTNQLYADYTDLIYANLEGTPKWYHGAEVGVPFNINIRVIAEGEFSDDEAELTAIYPASYIKGGEATDVEIDVTNRGTNDIKSLELSYQFADQTPVSQTVDVARSIKFGATETLKMKGIVYDGPAGTNIPLTISINKVNGVEDKVATNNAQTAYFWSGNKSFTRTMVVEEGTGTWCGYCPMGIVGLEYMKKNYPESFIGIAVHNGDEMVSGTYSSLVFSGYPNSNINRDYFEVQPTKENLEIVYAYEIQNPTFANVVFKEYAYNSDKSQLDVTVEAEFMLAQENAQYRLAFVVLENQVGPYRQSNYFAGGSNGPLDGWESKGSSVSMKFDDVARDIFTYRGINRSLPTEIEAGGKYTYDYSIRLNNVTNVANAEYVVLLIDGESGVIVNASKISNAQVEAGINDIEADQDVNAPIVFYNLQGVEVPAKNLTPGIYVKRQGQKTGKVVIR